jgi:L-malate glycosyltransferase
MRMKQNVTIALPTGLPASFGRTPSARTSSRRATGLRTPAGATEMKVSDLGEKGEQVVPRERIRIAFVIDLIGAWNLGGTEKQLAHLASTLDKRIFEPAIFVLKRTPGAAATDVGCPVISVNDSESQSRIALLLKLRSALKDFCPHIVQTFFIDGTFYGTLAAWLNRVPVIVQSRRNAGHWQKARHALALRAINHLVDSWQCNSHFVADRIRRMEHVPAERIAVLPNSIDLAHFSPVAEGERLATRIRLGLPADAPVFVAVATLRPVKGLSTIIEAAARIRAHLPQAMFLLVGEGPQRRELAEQIMQKNLAEMVRLVGGQQDVRPWLAAADIGILGSYSESSSNALLEYMAMGLPAVVSDIPANRELVSGEFFAAGNAAELAERLLGLWNQPVLRQDMSRRYREGAIPYGEASLSQLAQDYYIGLSSPFLRPQKTEHSSELNPLNQQVLKRKAGQW